MNRSCRQHIVLAVLICLGCTLACSQRLPKPKTARGAIEGYFESYGDKYKEGDFGRYQVDKVEITEMSERQRGMVAVEAYVSLGNGEIIYKIRATLLKKTLRWKVISWENLGKSS